MSLRANSQNARILRALADGRWRTAAQIQRMVGSTRLNSRMSELRNKHGFKIERDLLPGRKGALAHRYRLLNPPPEAELARLLAPPALPVDPLDRVATPRDDDNRYRIYRMVFDELVLLRTAATAAGVGAAIVELGNAGAFDGSCIGLLDTHGTDSTPGTWLVQPWDVTP